jgi:two-component system NtrC family sensor kinase
VFINLLVNAAQAVASRPPAEREIRVCTRHDEARNLVAIEFSDTGIGIAQEHIPHIFEPFFTTKKSGTGLGLSISRDIVKRMGGHIGVESEPSRGTTFTVSLSTMRVEESWRE